MKHTCHAVECKRAVPPTMLMCGPHWGIVPAALRIPVLRTYRRGQCDDKRPSNAWQAAAARVIAFVARSEGREAQAMHYDRMAARADARSSSASSEGTPQ